MKWGGRDDVGREAKGREGGVEDRSGKVCREGEVRKGWDGRRMGGESKAGDKKKKWLMLLYVCS